MPLQTPHLDDLRFQRDLVDEARKRIIHYCPEWTEYNLSDPGITLIELFAWMTEQLVYRLNRVPEKNYFKFLEMLGLRPLPASSAHTELTFWLSAPLPLEPGSRQTVVIPRGFEVRSEQTEDEIIFTTDETLEIVPPVLEHVRKEGAFNKNYLPRLGIEVFYPFGEPVPQAGDAFYLGFSPTNNLAGHILQLYFETRPTEAVGIRREDPPWVWEYLDEQGQWHELALSQREGEKDTTGGLNNESGSLVLYLPASLKPAPLYGLEAFWLRCRIEQRDPLQGMYTQSPRVMKIEPFSLGATVGATHSVSVEDEVLGISNGEPGQRFQLQHAPVLQLRPDETLLVEESQPDGSTRFVPWQRVESFARSTRFDRHYMLDTNRGEVSFGPAIRQPDGSVRQYGRIPESGRQIRFSRYRYGGGVQGNLPEGSLRTMLMSLAYVARVSNLKRAVGGRDAETLEELQLRAQRELQAQHRAVTAQDFEEFARRSSRSVARAYCLPPEQAEETVGNTVHLLIVPAVQNALQAHNLAALHLHEELRTTVQRYLDQYRLLTTTLRIREPRYYGVQVRARLVPQPFSNPAEVQQRVRRELERYLTPLPLDAPPLNQATAAWQGWPFGKALFAAEIIALIQQIPEVQYVMDVQLAYRPVLPLEENTPFGEEAPRPLQTVATVLRLPPDGLLCSLEHEIELVADQEAL